MSIKDGSVAPKERIYDYNNDGFQCLLISEKTKNIHNSLNTNEILSPALSTGKWSPQNDAILRESLCYQAAENSIMRHNKRTQNEAKERELRNTRQRQLNFKLKY